MEETWHKSRFDFLYPITIISFIQAWWYMISFIPALLKKNQNKNRLIPDSYRLISSQLHQSNLRKLGHHRRTFLKQISAAKKPVVQKKSWGAALEFGASKSLKREKCGVSPPHQLTQSLTKWSVFTPFFLQMFFPCSFHVRTHGVIVSKSPRPPWYASSNEANSQSLPSSNCWYI